MCVKVLKSCRSIHRYTYRDTHRRTYLEEHGLVGRAHVEGEEDVADEPAREAERLEVGPLDRRRVCSLCCICCVICMYQLCSLL